MNTSGASLPTDKERSSLFARWVADGQRSLIPNRGVHDTQDTSYILKKITRAYHERDGSE